MKLQVPKKVHSVRSNEAIKSSTEAVADTTVLLLVNAMCRLNQHQPHGESKKNYPEILRMFVSMVHALLVHYPETGEIITQLAMDTGPALNAESMPTILKDMMVCVKDVDLDDVQDEPCMQFDQLQQLLRLFWERPSTRAFLLLYTQEKSYSI